MQRDKKIFLLDVDGVACDHAKSVCAMVNLDFGLSSCREDVTRWDYDFGPIDFLQAVNKYYPNESFIESMEVHDGFHELLKWLNNHFVVEFATNRSVSHQATVAWIMRNFGNFRISFVANKNDIVFDYIIDDYPKTVIEAAIKNRTAFLIKRPWNYKQEVLDLIEATPNAHFIETFDQIENLLQKSL